MLLSFSGSADPKSGRRQRPYFENYAVFKLHAKMYPTFLKKKSFINKILTRLNDFGTRFAINWMKQSSPLILFSL